MASRLGTPALAWALSYDAVTQTQPFHNTDTELITARADNYIELSLGVSSIILPPQNMNNILGVISGHTCTNTLQAAETAGIDFVMTAL